MRTKLISSDAKSFLQNAARDLGILLYFNGREKVPPGTLIPESFKKANERLYTMMSIAEKWLKNPAFWNDSEETPKLITDANTGPNGDWNGNKFFKTRIKGKLVLFKNALFDVTGLCSADEAKLLVVRNYEEARAEIAFLKSRSDAASSNLKPERQPIPIRIRTEVWRRDGGKCVECGSVYNLEFDHLIPVVKGGSNTARNIRILCEPCNRRKSDRIG